MLQAYKNDPSLKESVLATMASHRKADTLVKGSYWENGKGCAVGCLIHSGNHEEYENKFGIPKALAQLEDSIFEGLPNEKAMLWPEKFLSAFEVGKDYSKVWNRFAVWMLIDPDDGVIRYADEQGEIAIKAVAKLHQEEIEGDAARGAARDAARDAADAARGAARDAARVAAWVAADAAWVAADAARGAARDAAWVAAWVAADAARDAARGAARDAAWVAADAADAAYERMADKLIELIKSV